MPLGAGSRTQVAGFCYENERDSTSRSHSGQSNIFGAVEEKLFSHFSAMMVLRMRNEHLCLPRNLTAIFIAGASS